jgi:hypothetical protein
MAISSISRYVLVEVSIGEPPFQIFTVHACISGKIRQAGGLFSACLQAVWQNFYRSRILF